MRTPERTKFHETTCLIVILWNIFAVQWSQDKQNTKHYFLTDCINSTNVCTNYVQPQVTLYVNYNCTVLSLIWEATVCPRLTPDVSQALLQTIIALYCCTFGRGVFDCVPLSVSQVTPWIKTVYCPTVNLGNCHDSPL
jgi:ABC-type phosphate/phosphonate transport system permease subunit